MIAKTRQPVETSTSPAGGGRARPARRPLALIVAALSAAACVAVKGGGSGMTGRGGEPGDGGPSRPDVLAQDAGRFSSTPDGSPARACRNLQCQQAACAGGGDTTLTGTEYAPDGTLPL